ncbi:glycosyltransferase family 2 protein [Methylophaga sp.]|uniref:glycosyltransferase family 2 protein n=1 Tax=Methylophaga sp. TaxID=2024840 RepID=UPI003A8FA684
MNLNSPSLTIALPVFNGGAALRSAVQSIIDQSYQDWELLIIDDGSTDGMIEQLPQISDPRVRIICDGENKGLAARLNEAIKIARGVYFGRMDHDDICHPDRFFEQISYLNAHDEVDLLGAQCVAINERNELIGALPTSISHNDICSRPWVGFYMPHPTWCGRIEWFRRYLYKESPAPYCCEDQELLLRTYAMSHYHVLPRYLLAYRVRSNTTLRRSWKNRWAWCREQINLLGKKRKYIYVLLSVLVTICRISLDVGKKIKTVTGGAVSQSDQVGPEVELVWNEIISKVSNVDISK